VEIDCTCNPQNCNNLRELEAAGTRSNRAGRTIFNKKRGWLLMLRPFFLFSGISRKMFSDGMDAAPNILYLQVLPVKRICRIKVIMGFDIILI